MKGTLPSGDLHGTEANVEVLKTVNPRAAAEVSQSLKAAILKCPEK